MQLIFFFFWLFWCWADISQPCAFRYFNTHFDEKIKQHYKFAGFNDKVKTLHVITVKMYTPHTWYTVRFYTEGRGENRKRPSPDIRCGHFDCAAARLPLSTRRLHGDKQSQKHTSRCHHYLSPNIRGTACSSRWDTCFLPVSSLLNRNFVRDTLRMVRRHPQQTSHRRIDTRFRTCGLLNLINLWESHEGHRPGHEADRGCWPLPQPHDKVYPQLFLKNVYL